MTAEDDKLRKTFGLPEVSTFECEYQDVDCDIRGPNMECERNKHPMEVCPGEDEEDDDD